MARLELEIKVEWEYMQATIARPGYNRVDILNDYGKEGWELVQIQDFYEPYAEGIFKRVKVTNG